jgi:hypothetical protein
MHWRKLTPRRAFLKAMAGAALPIGTIAGHPQSTSVPSPGDLGVKLISSFPHATLTDVSPDAKRICLYLDRNPIRTFTYTGEWTELMSPKSGKDGLRFIETGSWKSIGGLSLRERPLIGSFFADGEALYVETQPITGNDGKFTAQRALIDIRTQKVDEITVQLNARGVSFHYAAVEDRNLLGSAYNTAAALTEAFVKVEAGSYREIRRVPLVSALAAGLDHREVGPTVSGDRRAFVFFFDGEITYRRTSDLEIVWSRQIDPGLRAWKLAMSHDGALVAASIAERQLIRPDPQKCYVQIYDGLNGSPVGRLALGPITSVALSPDRRLLAVTKSSASVNKPSEVELSVLVFEIGSGRKVATLTHDRIAGSHLAIRSLIETMFTSDGKYLISSGFQTKVWSTAGL